MINRFVQTCGQVLTPLLGVPVQPSFECARPLDTLTTQTPPITWVSDRAHRVVNPSLYRYLLYRSSIEPAWARRQLQHSDGFDTIHCGDTCELKTVPDRPDLLVSIFKPTVFSYEAQGAVDVPGLAVERAKLHQYFANLLLKHGIPTATILVDGDRMLVTREVVPNIEVIVKTAVMGSTVHVYGGIELYLQKMTRHAPDVRFDWRQAPPNDDVAMSDDMANRFINTHTAKRLVRSAFAVLRGALAKHDLDLLDACFFVNEEGNIIVGEVSTDNTRFVYTGSDPELQRIFDLKAPKNDTVIKVQTLLNLLTGKPDDPR